MIVLINYFSGELLRRMSSLLLALNPSLTLQFNIIKHKITESNKLEKPISSNLIYSLVAIEDRRFFQHRGIDLYAIIRAIIKNLTTNRFEGASTITQQLIRNITDEREIKYQRKIKEIMLASLINQEFEKKEILFAYFNTYKFNNCVGIFSFCRLENYNLDNLSLIESAEIAARFKYPFVHEINYPKYLKRVRKIEKILLDRQLHEQQVIPQTTNSVWLTIKRKNPSLQIQ